jgi:hypothetical protein
MGFLRGAFSIRIIKENISCWRNNRAKGEEIMEYITDIIIELKTGDEKTTHVFPDENVIINRSSHLWIKNNSKDESEFFETVKLWHEMDRKTNITSFYKIETSVPTPVEKFRTYKVKSINEENQAILFDIV